MSSKPENLEPQLPVLVPTLQIGFYARLKESQAEYLLPALLDTVVNLEIAKLDRDLATLAGDEKLRYLARFGLRGELLFPVPYLLEEKPKLIGYYRLLLGFSQKEFYNSSSFGMFSGMETRGTLPPRLHNLLPSLCSSLIQSAWTLAIGIPFLSQDIFNALTLLTLGGQLRGSYNNQLGQKATKVVFEMIKAIVNPAILAEDSTSITIKNAAHRQVRIEFAPDPDIAVREQLPSGRFNNRIALRSKGEKIFRTSIIDWEKQKKAIKKRENRALPNFGRW